MKVLYFTKYSRLGASSRLRSFQYFPLFTKNGIDIDVSPLFDDHYLNMLYSGKKSIFWIIRCYLKRLFIFPTCFFYDKIVIEKELFPFFPAVFEQILSVFKIKYIVDYDDAIFHNYDLNTNIIIRSLLKAKIDVVMKGAETVIVGNNYLGEKALNAGATRVVRIPTVIDLKRYKFKENFKLPIKIGWIGSPSTIKYLETIKDVLENLLDKYKVNLIIIGGYSEKFSSSRVSFMPWTEQSEVELISNLDIGIMPLVNSPWELGKCSYKLIQYMAAGIPVVASNVGMNHEVVNNGKNGFLVNSKEEWFEALEKYILDENLRINHGLAGFQMVEEKYNINITAPQLEDILYQC
jgi:glycosyltransferase involved in cell wall biosynthesis